MLKALGIFLLLLPFVPLEPFFGMFKDDIGNFTPLHWGLGTLIAFGVSATWAFLWDGSRASAFRLRWNVPQTVLVRIAFGLVLGLIITNSFFVFQHRPLLVDSVVQLFQARIFASGTVTAPTPPFPEFFITQHVVVDGARWYAQYPPGHSLLLAIGFLVGAPWIVSIVLSMLAALLLYRFVRVVYDQKTATVTALLLPLCGFFLFMSASFMNHVSTLFFLALALYGFARWEAAPNLSRWLFLCGLGVGGAFAGRPLCALAASVALFVWGIGGIRSGRHWRQAFAGAVGVLPFASLYFVYNALTTGDAFLPGYLKLWGESHNIGFHLSPWGEEHTPWAGLGKQLRNISILNEFLFESMVPGLWPIGFLFVFAKPSRWDRRLLGWILVFPALYFFYWHRDSFLGPRFLYASLLGVLPLTARAAILAFEWAEKRQIRLSSSRAVFVRTWLTMLSLILVGYIAIVGLPQRFHIYASSLKSMKFDLPAFAQEQGINRAVIFVPVSWGTRILNELRSVGIGASEAEQLYRKSDHCLLQQLIDDVRRSPVAAEVVSARAWEITKEPVVRVKANDDATLRLRPNKPLLPQCRDEILYDQKGYALYMPYLAANDPFLRGDLVIATDLRERNELLIQALGNRPAYIFRNNRFERIESKEKRDE